MRQERKPPSKRATASNTNPVITNVTRGSRTGEQHLLKWIDLLSQNGNSHDHQMARLLAQQCHEIATHPTFNLKIHVAALTLRIRLTMTTQQMCSAPR